MLSILDIIIITAGGIAIILYAVLKIRQTIKYNKEFNECIKNGMTKLQAKKYCDELFNKKKRKKVTQEEEKDEIYEE